MALTGWWTPLALGTAAVAIPFAAWRLAVYGRLLQREVRHQAAFEAAKGRIHEEAERMFSLTPEQLKAALQGQGYFLDDLNTARLWSYLRHGKPVGLRGEPGIGKSQLPEAFARAMDWEFIDLECHSQLEADEIGVSWNGFKQIVDAQSRRPDQGPLNLYSLEYLNRTPLLESLLKGRPTVVRVDEVDKLNEHTTNFFLRYLDKKELVVHNLQEGERTLRAQAPLYVFLTSNEYKRLDTAFMRRMVWLDLTFPGEEVLARILEVSAGVPADFAARSARILCQVRQLNLEKKPAISEGIEWTRAMADLSDGSIDPRAFDITIGYLAKYKEDEVLIKEALRRWYDGFYRSARTQGG